MPRRLAGGMGRTTGRARWAAAAAAALLLALALLPRAALVGAQLDAGDEEGSLLADPRVGGGAEEGEEEDGEDWLWRGDAQQPPPPPGNGTNGTDSKSTLAQVGGGALEGSGRGAAGGSCRRQLGPPSEQRGRQPPSAGALAAFPPAGTHREQHGLGAGARSVVRQYGRRAAAAGGREGAPGPLPGGSSPSPPGLEPSLCKPP